MAVQISNNGGGSWTNLFTFTGTVADSSFSYDISAYATASTRVRFIEVNGYSGNDSFFVDNVQMRKNGIDAGHWVTRSHPAEVAELIASHVAAHPG